MEKSILIGASKPISSQAIAYHLQDFPSESKQAISVLDGNASLVNYAKTKWPSVNLISSKKKNEARSILQNTSNFLLLWDGEDLTNFLFEARLSLTPTKVIPVEVTRIVNKNNTDDYDIYIGRGSLWGNPFAIGHGDGPNRDEVIDKYKEYFHRKIEEDKSFKNGLFGLRGKKLACFCKPLACHGDVIAEYLDKLPRDEEFENEIDDKPKEST